MNEQEFIYGRLKYLNDRIEFLYATIEKQQDLMRKISDIIEQMQSPEYANKQVKLAEMKDVADKIEFIRKYTKR
jgi:hemerythrin superfamily protein